MSELLIILVSNVIATIVAYFSTYDVPGPKGKKFFKILLLVNFLVGGGIITYKFFEDKKAAQKIDTLTHQNDSILNNSRQMLVKQDTLKALMNKIGISPDFEKGDLYLNVNNNFPTFINQISRINLQQNVKLSEVLGMEKPNSDSTVRGDTTPARRQAVTETDMGEGSCIDKIQNRTYTKVCFNNQTGEDLKLEKYYGFWGSPVTDETLSLPKGEISCAVRMLVNSVDGSQERDFKFYFTFKDGRQLATPYQITLKSCTQYTITLTKGNLGL